MNNYINQIKEIFADYEYINITNISLYQ